MAPTSMTSTITAITLKIIPMIPVISPTFALELKGSSTLDRPAKITARPTAIMKSQQQHERTMDRIPAIIEANAILFVSSITIPSFL